MSDYLPQEVLIQILTRTHVKSILRFRCVSKTWYSLISSPAFITTHLHQALHHTETSERDHLLFRYKLCTTRNHGYTLSTNAGERFALHLNEESFPHNSPIKLDFPHSTDFLYHIVASVHGIVCLAGQTSCLLWNPSIKRTIKLPIELKFSFRPDMHRLGFGYDRTTNDYKLVYLARGCYPELAPEASIYTLNTSSKRKSALPCPLNIDEHNPTPSEAFVSGALHWVVCSHAPNMANFQYMILAFDMSTEVFHVFMLPRCLATKEQLNMNVTVFKGSLSLVPNNYILRGEESYSVWIMEEYGMTESWTKLLDIDTHGQEQVSRGIAFRKNGEVLYTSKTGRLFSYEPNAQETRDINFGRWVNRRPLIHCAPELYYINTYVESLVLLNASSEICTSLTASPEIRKKIDTATPASLLCNVSFPLQQ